MTARARSAFAGGLVVLWEAIGSMEMEVVLVDEALGY